LLPVPVSPIATKRTGFEAGGVVPDEPPSVFPPGSPLELELELEVDVEPELPDDEPPEEDSPGEAPESASPPHAATTSASETTHEKRCMFPFSPRLPASAPGTRRRRISPYDWRRPLSNHDSVSSSQVRRIPRLVRR